MSESIQGSATGVDSPKPHRTLKFIRRFVYPVLVIAAIAAVIWWIEYRDDGPTSSTGERYGPVALEASLLPIGVDVGTGEGDLAPNFLLESLAEGDEVRLSDYRGSAVVLNFWATWCRPCRSEMPQFVQASDDLKDEGLVVIAVNMQEGRGVAQPFADDYGMDFPVAIDRDGEVGDEFRILGLPTTYFIDRDGVIQSVFTGPLEAEGEDDTDVLGALAQTELESRIAEILE